MITAGGGKASRTDGREARLRANQKRWDAVMGEEIRILDSLLEGLQRSIRSMQDVQASAPADKRSRYDQMINDTQLFHNQVRHWKLGDRR